MQVAFPVELSGQSAKPGPLFQAESSDVRPGQTTFPVATRHGGDIERNLVAEIVRER